MKDFNIAILGCGTVGGGVAKILLEMNDELCNRTGRKIVLKKIVELFPKKASEKFNIPLDFFCGNGNDLSLNQAMEFIEKINEDKEIDLVIETIGGSNDNILKIVLEILKSKKHLVTANKALLAEKENIIFNTAMENNVAIGFEAAVCGAIPIIKTIKESFTGDEILSFSGIMNGTSNYILSMMQNESISFKEALKLAQKKGYAEADPTLDINGSDAGHKLIITTKLAFGIDLSLKQLSIIGIENINQHDLDFAREMECRIKLICLAKKIDKKIYATVCPMMVKNNNFLSKVDGATNAIRIVNKYSGEHLLLGKGAGSLETASSIVADIVFIAKYSNKIVNYSKNSDYEFFDAKYFIFPYNIIFETEDIPGITGIITTAIGNHKINIDTVGHNRHNKNRAIFSIATMPCSLNDINNAINEIRIKRPNILLIGPKIIPILY